jgi:hypothetical protein
MQVNLCIDPGPEFSGFCITQFDLKSIKVLRAGIVENRHLVSPEFCEENEFDSIKIEVMSGSTNAGKDVINTLIWTGRIIQAMIFNGVKATDIDRVDRQSVVKYFKSFLPKDVLKISNDSLVSKRLEALRTAGKITGMKTKSHASAALALEIFAKEL